MRTQVGIVGAGPAGLLLSLLLHRAGIDTVVLERHSMAHVLGRIRAGVLEPGTVETLVRAGVAERLEREGLRHAGIELLFDGARHRIDLAGPTGGRSVTVYGQTEITRDLLEALRAEGRLPIEEAEALAIEGIDGVAPEIVYRHEGRQRRLRCEFVVGCDGFHGIGRRAIPESVRTEHERIWPFGWLGVLADVPPVAEELIYVSDPRGFALCSMRSRSRSRYYIQCAIDEQVDAWPDARFWDELRRRLDPKTAAALVTGPAIEKSVAPLRSFVVEPMRRGRLLLAGDAAHIVPPTGAKGLNLAVSDVRLAADALIEHYETGSTAALDTYSEHCLARAWQAMRFSWWMTGLLHRHPEADAFDRRLQAAELRQVAGSPGAAAALAEGYLGLFA